MRLGNRFGTFVLLLALAALVVSPAMAAADKKDGGKAATGPLEVTYYYLPG